MVDLVPGSRLSLMYHSLCVEGKLKTKCSFEVRIGIFLFQNCGKSHLDIPLGKGLRYFLRLHITSKDWFNPSHSTSKVLKLVLAASLLTLALLKG